MEKKTMEQFTGKEIVKDMKHLVKLLHKEWERSGRTKAEVMITLDQSAAVNRRLAARIVEKQKQLEAEDKTFQQSMALSKENFVLLRVVKKIKKAEDKTNQKGIDSAYSVELDKEEYKLFMELVGTAEV